MAEKRMTPDAFIDKMHDLHGKSIRIDKDAPEGEEREEDKSDVDDLLEGMSRKPGKDESPEVDSKTGKRKGTV